MLGMPGAGRCGGLIFALAAYGLWGVMPLYFRAVANVRPIEVLAHRVVWSVLFLAGLLTVLGAWPAVRASLANPRTRRVLVASTLLIASNWFVFICGVSTGQVVQASLGYYINPLLNVLLGVLLFRERLRRAQWLGLALAAAGLVYLVVAQGEWPWLALFLAGSFAAYGALRKVARVDAVVGLSIETLLLLPAALGMMAYWNWEGRLGLGALGTGTDLLLLAAGVVTAVPLLCFGAAARRLPLSTLGFVQYLSPTLSFLLAVLYLGEPFRPAQQVCFGLIWSALLLVSLDGLLLRAPAGAGTGPPCCEAAVRKCCPC
jgi:chloramphenicol-sensitive protein RarD